LEKYWGHTNSIFLTLWVKKTRASQEKMNFSNASPRCQKATGPRCQKATRVFNINLLGNSKELELDFFIGPS
jgi:hypothetical protein